MRLKQPIIAVTVLGLFAIAACGGDGDGGESSENTGKGEERANEGGNTGAAQDATRVDGPFTIDGATEGGTIKVLSNFGLNTMHPSEAYYQNTSTILSGLVTRAMTQYSYDPETESMVLIPDLATDLGTPNDDYTEWTFELKDGIKYEDGSPVKPEDFVFSAAASMDRTPVPRGPRVLQRLPARW